MFPSAFVSNRNTELVTEGQVFYNKFRLINYSFNNSDIHQEQIEIMGHNSGLKLDL
jgi:hypothetical protein